ncbi:SGNH/GDSL hydrolase family protein [bacterium]|nr:SGNH/GDSL hydrolase family protein [bacterium]
MRCTLSFLLVKSLVIPIAFADMMKDSPVTFPEHGALPAKYPPDQPSKEHETPEEGYYIFSSPERSLAQIKKIQAEMPKGEFSRPKPDWTHLSRTRRILTEGGDLHLLAMGDSIVNDTMRSGWVAKLHEAYPKANIRATVYVRGGGGCQHYKEEGRLAKYVIPRRPNLVFIGGISQRDIESIRVVIRELRAALPEVEILLATGTFGTADPRVPEELAKAAHSGTSTYGAALKQLATEERCAYLDMTTPWAEYIRSAKVHPHRFYRDAVHANGFGEQILSKILMAFSGPAERAAVATLTAGADGLKRGCFFAYLPDDNLFCVRIDFNQQSVRLPSAVALGKQCRSVTVRVTQQGSETSLLETVLPVKNGVSDEVRLALPPLAGRYEAQFTLKGLPEPLVLTKPFVRESFPWEGNNLGISGEIYPPYEPVKVDGHNVSVVLRRYTLNGFGLWDKLVTQGRGAFEK